MKKPHILVSKTLIGIMLAEDKEAILFRTSSGDIVAKCDADCCSHTWVEHIELPVNGLPAVVLSVQDIELNADLDTQKGELSFYGCKIATDKGDIVIDYRNESNGYYGGNLTWPDDYFYGGVYGQNVSEEKWREVVA
jgi:hypothetical protein